MSANLNWKRETESSITTGSTLNFVCDYNCESRNLTVSGTRFTLTKRKRPTGVLTPNIEDIDTQANNGGTVYHMKVKLHTYRSHLTESGSGPKDS